jgi:hypothetical protein
VHTYQSEELSWTSLVRDLRGSCNCSLACCVPRVLTMLHIVRVGALHCSPHAFRLTCQSVALP